MKLLAQIFKAFFPPFVLYLFQYIFSFIYVLWPGFDNPMHFFGGVTMGITGFILLRIAQKENRLHIKSKWISTFIVVCFVAFMATLWEFHEFFMDRYLGTFTQLSIADTMKDMLLGLFGALVSGTILEYKKEKK